MKKIVFIHFTPPGVVGGVEEVMAKHLELLRPHFELEVIAGREADLACRLHVIPEIDAALPENDLIDRQLSAGAVAPAFLERREAILLALQPVLHDADAVIVHNAFTLHFSLPLTAAMWTLAAKWGDKTFIAWTHDLSWTNPLYIPSMHDEYPWELLKLPAPNVTYVCVSEERKRELEALWALPQAAIRVVPNGVDVEQILRLSPVTASLAKRHQLFEKDAVLLLPVRITRRKNVEMGLHVTKCLRDRGKDVAFLISGPTAPHHPSRSRTYLQELKDLRALLGLDDQVIFVADELGHNLALENVVELYGLADVLLFPSTQEGFGLPILEAGLLRVPPVLSDIPVFREVGGREGRFFRLGEDPDVVADLVLQVLESATHRLYRRVLREYRWDVILEERILPLLPSVAAA